MARFNVIEKAIGTVYGDIARLGPQEDVVSPVDAMCLLDRHAGRATRGFGYVKSQSGSGSYNVYEIAQRDPIAAKSTETEARDVVRRHGSLVAALVVYNS